MIIDQLFTRPIFEAADPNKLIVTVTIWPMSAEDDTETKDLDLTGVFQGDARSQINQAMAYLKKFFESKGRNFTDFQATYQGRIVNQQNRGSMEPQNDAERKLHSMADQMRAKHPAQDAIPALKEFAPSDDDSNGSDSEELLRRMAAHWWNGNERQMAKVENTLAAMGWEIGQDEGYDDGGVFVVRAGDEHGGSYISWPHADLELNEATGNATLSENAEDLHVGDPVIITGNGLKFEGATGEISRFGREKRFVVVNLYNHGLHSFHSSDVSFNEYAGSDDEEARMYDAGEFGDDPRNDMDEGRKKKNKKTSRSLGRYFFPGFGYYGSGESGEGGGDGGGGESANPGMAEGSDQQLSVRQLATISDEALDKAYGYGRSSPGNTFGWQANLKSAAYAKHMIDKGVTDIDEIADAIHKGWNVTAKAFVKNPNRFDDTEKLKAAGKLEAKLQQRAKLMNIDYSQLPDDEQEKDRVVARALLQAITGGGEQNMSEATDPKRDKAERMIWKYFGQIYDYGDDDGLNYLDEQGDLWNQLMDKYNGEIDDIVAQEPLEVLMRAAQELKGIAGDMKYELDEQGVVTKNATGLKHRATDKYGAGDDEPHHYTGGRSGFSEPGKYARDLEHVNKQLVKDLDASMGISWKNRGPKGLEVDEQGVTEGEYDSRKPFGVRYKVFAGREGRVTTREYWTSSEQKLQRAVAKIEALDNFYEIDGYSYPKEQQGVAEGLTEMDKSQTPPGRDTGPRSGPDQYVKPITSKQMQDRALDKLNQAVKDSHKKKDVKESDTLMMKLKRAMVREGRVKELADDLKTMPDADFMKKYGKAKAAIRADMKRVDEAGISRLDKKDFDFRDGLVGDDETGYETQNEPELGMFRMGKPVEPNDAATNAFISALTPSQQDNRFTAPAGWRYVEKDEDPARYGSGPAAATSALPNLIYDPQSRTLKSADAPALDQSPKSKFKFDRTTQSQVPADGSGANANIDAATRDRARAYAAKQNAPAAAAKQKVDWKTIYALNKATIGSNPNVIRPRMQLNMPNGTIYLVQPGDTLTKIAAKQNQVNELSTEKLAQYKTAAAADAKRADQEGDFKRGNQRFSGIVKATKKQFDNDAKQVDESRAARRALMAKIVNHR